MRKLVILSLALALAACGRERRISGFEDYVSRFESASQQAGHAVTVSALVIDFDDTGKVDLAQCETGNLFSTPHIRINQNRWSFLNEDQREELLFHEMGHCVLDRLHRTDRLADGSPASIMFPTILQTATYQQNRDYYLQELFSTK